MGADHPLYPNAAMVAAKRQGYTAAQKLDVISDRKRKVSWKDIEFRHGIKARLGQKWVHDAANLEALLNAAWYQGA